jgi:MFS family permease
MNALRCLSYDDVAKEKQPVGAQNTTVTWRQLPHKSQLAILAMSRFVDFFQTASLQAYMFFQLVSFNSSLSTATIAWQAGILQGSFTMAQCLTAVLWGRMADNPRWGGRKRVLLASLLGTSISCIGVAFSTTFLQSVAWRTIGGALNGGNVGVV